MASCDSTERLEARALLAWHAAFRDSLVPGVDWRIEKVGDALCSVSSTEPSILLNRVLELGSDRPPDAARLQDIRDLYEEAGVARFFLHVLPQRKLADTDALLHQAGYEKYRGWMKFVRTTGQVPAAGGDLEVRAVGPARGAEFAAIAAPAFDMRPETRPLVALLPGAEGYHAFMSFDADAPAGTGVLFADGDVGMLDWGTTHPDFRRRGGQIAVLGARIAHAAAIGCKTICTMTGEAVPGEPQHSYANILRAGFEEAYLRENWVPAARPSNGR